MLIGTLFVFERGFICFHTECFCQITKKFAVQNSHTVPTLTHCISIPTGHYMGPSPLRQVYFRVFDQFGHLAECSMCMWNLLPAGKGKEIKSFAEIAKNLAGNLHILVHMCTGLSRYFSKFVFLFLSFIIPRKLITSKI